MIINYTPHTINEVTTGKSYPSNGVARVESQTHWLKNTIDDVPLCTTKLGEVQGLPGFVEDTYIIVSGLVFDASNRVDLLAPGMLVRDDNGQPIGCNGFRAK